MKDEDWYKDTNLKVSKMPSKLIIGFPDCFSIENLKEIRNFIDVKLHLNAEYLVLDEKHRLIIERMVD